MRALPLAVAAALVVPAAPAGAYIPGETPTRRAEAAVLRAASSPPAIGSTPGVVVERAGRTVFALNRDRAFKPASLMKLATTTAAILRFGGDHRFTTRVLRRASTLYLVGGGDPTLSTVGFVSENYLPQADDPAPVPVFPSGAATVESLAAAVARAGVERADAILVDESLFDSRRTQPGWRPTYIEPTPDVGLLSALTVNEGFVDPKRSAVSPEPALAAGEALSALLAAHGITVAAPPVRGVAPAESVEVARVSSPPLSEIVGYVNRWSVNGPAEMLLKSLGAAFGEGGTTREGARIVRETLADAGIPLGGFAMADGSGLSELDRMTPRTVAALVRWIAADSRAGALRDSIPVAGGAGTLARRMKDTPAEGNLRGKTGLIRGVRAMAGWVEGADGVPIVYVAVFNGAARASALTAALDLIGLTLTRYPY